MAKSCTTTYTNNTPSGTRTVQLYDTNDMTQYGHQYGSDRTSYLNVTADSDATEKFVIFSGNRKNVSTSCEVANPSPRRLAAMDKNQKVDEGVQFGVYSDVIFKEIDSDDASYRVDYPWRITIQFEGQNIGTVTDALIGEELERTISHLKDSNNKWRFTELRGKVTNINAD